MILVNGKAVDCISALDRGLAYGDGVFETLAVRDAEPEFWSLHWQRLEAGCKRLGFTAPDVQHLKEDAQRLLGEDPQAAVLKILVSRGSGGRGYKAPDLPSPIRVVSSYPATDYPDAYLRDGIALHLCKTPLACNPALAGLKHLNRLEQVLARGEWLDSSIAEGLMLDLQGQVIEGVMSNLFWVKDGAVFTPDLSHCGVAGIMRGRIMVALGDKLEIVQAELQTLLAADEVFVCNSVIGIWPVASLLDQRWSVGPLTTQLQQQIEKDRACSKGYC